jgi:hypothetical protein
MHLIDSAVRERPAVLTTGFQEIPVELRQRRRPNGLESHRSQSWKDVPRHQIALPGECLRLDLHRLSIQPL